VRLHVAAKRYLCAVEPSYFNTLSPASVHSLQLQGGPMSTEEIAEFEQSPFYPEAVRLRRWDDLAKDPEMTTAGIEHFLEFVPLCAKA
jgi:predicted HD phosphohydrolase